MEKEKVALEEVARVDEECQLAIEEEEDEPEEESKSEPLIQIEEQLDNIQMNHMTINKEIKEL